MHACMEISIYIDVYIIVFYVAVLYIYLTTIDANKNLSGVLATNASIEVQSFQNFGIALFILNFHLFF